MGVIDRRSLWLPIVLLVVGAVIAGCAGSASAPVLSTVGAPIDQGGGGAEPEPAASAAPSAASAEGGSDGFQRSDGGDNVPAIPRDDLKIVYTGSLQLVVADLQAALEKAKTAVLATGGYIGASQESNTDDRPVATITYRIPASRWDGAIEALRGLATKVVAEQTEATEVGGQIVDLEARLRNLRASEASLQEIAKGAGKISDLLEVEAQLTDIRGQIEQLDGQRARLEDQVAYGTLVTTFGLEVVAVEETAKGWNPAQDVDAATATLIGAGQTIVSGLIWFGIVWLPLILVFVVLAVVIRRLIRRFLPAAPGPGGGPIAGWGEGA